MSKIEWTEKTWNPVAGCSLVSPGCTNCYAMQMAARLDAMGQEKYAGLTKRVNGSYVWTGTITLDDKALMIPLKRKKPTVWFVNSMSDLFHEAVPDEFIAQVFAVMGLCNWHTYQLLTKRTSRMRELLTSQRFAEMVEDEGLGFETLAEEAAQRFGLLNVHSRLTTDWRATATTELPLPNVWLGVSCEDQQRADERIPELLKTPAAVRFLSCEPLLGPINLMIDGECSEWRCPECGSSNVDPHGGLGGDDVSTWACPDCNDVGRGEDADWKSRIDWVIVGGESGHHARSCNIDWIRDLVNQCKSTKVPVFVKQLGSRPFDPSWHGDGTPEGSAMETRDAKGGDASEWPEELRVRELPEVAA